MVLREDFGGSAPRVYVLLLRQDDPRKCTAAKLARLRLATPLFRVRQIPRKSLVLNPFASQVVLPNDRPRLEKFGLVAIDCSWEKAQEALTIRLPGLGRRLPTLLASNPVNYAKPHKLSSAEALASALQITGFKEKARKLLAPFKWGPGFFTLNSEPLKSYSSVSTASEISTAEAQFF